MAVSEHESGTKSADGTEQTLNTTSPEGTDGAFQLWIDTSAMAKDDVLEIRIKEKVTSGGTQRLALPVSVLSNAQDAPAWVSPALLLLHGWDMTIKQTAGTNRSYPWSIRKVA